MSRKWKRTRSGVASFYIVAISTLVLVIVVTSFAAVIISEVNRTANDDLAQSAYDSALAGVEDAKLAYYNYVKCSEDSSRSGCKVSTGGGEVNIVDIVDKVENRNCSMVKTILGRGEDGTTEVKVEEDNGNNMEQAYTCVIMSPVTDDYEITVSESAAHVAKVKLADGVNAKDIKSIIVSWGVKNGDALVIPQNEKNLLEVGVVQTAKEFALEDFETTTVDGKTDRGTVFLNATRTNNNKTNDENRENLKKMLLKSNDKTAKNNELENEPYEIYCPEGVSDVQGGYACVTQIDLPDPVPGSDGSVDRNNDTFYVTLGVINIDLLDVKLEFCTRTDCAYAKEVEIDGETETAYYSNSESIAPLKMQVKVDSTGRANDLYRRVETRLGASGTGDSLGLDFAVQANNIKKIDAVTCEQHFGAENCNN